VAEMDETDRRDWNHIALLQLLREIRPRRYLLHAIRVGDIDDVVGCLRGQGGADPNREVNCCTPVWWAAYFGQAEVVRVLAAHGAAMDTPCTGPSYPGSSSSWLRLGPMTPLTLAAAAGDMSVAGALLECGAAPDNGTYWDRWPLLAASIFGHAPLCHLLLQAGAAAHKKTCDGVTALWICSHYSVRCSTQVALIRALVVAGADPFDSTPHRPPMFSWSAIAEKQRLARADDICAQAGCRWPRFGSKTRDDLPAGYIQLLGNDWQDAHRQSCIQDIVSNGDPAPDICTV
jgi:hypothetical protein